MKKINNKDFAEDVIRIQAVLARFGVEASLTESEELWERFSGSVDAQWINVPDDDAELYSCVSELIENSINQ